VRTLARVRWKRMAGTSICGARDARTPLSVGALWSEVVSPGGARDRVHFKTLGTARRGHPIEEIVRQAETGETTASRVELVEASEASLDDALFDRPPDYRPALPQLHGGYDLTKPDTFANRLQSYRDERGSSSGESRSGSTLLFSALFNPLSLPRIPSATLRGSFRAGDFTRLTLELLGAVASVQTRRC
jgi:hypothetical protein